MIEINNRRYIGSKTKLLKRIKEAIPAKYLSNKFSFADIFAGTGVVAYYFSEFADEIYINDILYCNTVAYKAFFSDEQFDEKKIHQIIKSFNSLNPSLLESNYFSDVYGDKYFSKDDAKKIGYIRDGIEKIKDTLNEREYYILLSSLIYTTDKIANTCGHFESFLAKNPSTKGVNLQMLNLKRITNCHIFNMDANALAKTIDCDVVYIDPPYNARQYVNFYHVLENLARWEKPTEFEGNSMKFKRNHLKSGYSRSSAPKLMKELIDSIKAKVIVVSYNNTYDAKSGASNNKITEEELVQILKNKGTLSIVEVEHKFFNAGKTDLKNHLEKIYVCEVN